VENGCRVEKNIADMELLPTFVPLFLSQYKAIDWRNNIDNIGTDNLDVKKSSDNILMSMMASIQTNYSRVESAVLFVFFFLKNQIDGLVSLITAW